MNEIEVHEDIIQFFSRYTQTRPVKIPVLMDRILREWYIQVTKFWKKAPYLIPKYHDKPLDKIDLAYDLEKKTFPLQRVPENKVSRVGINSDIARDFKAYANEFKINPCDLATWLCRGFIVAFELRRMETLNQTRDMPKLQTK